eukprot:154281-Hanusia_phi.AAC.1
MRSCSSFPPPALIRSSLSSPLLNTLTLAKHLKGRLVEAEEERRGGKESEERGEEGTGKRGERRGWVDYERSWLTSPPEDSHHSTSTSSFLVRQADPPRKVLLPVVRERVQREERR